MTATPHLTQSNGGVIGFSTGGRLPVRTVLSGPSTGVVGAQAIGAVAGFADLITFDMGGTSTDVALLQDGRCRLAAEATVHGYPIKAPMLDIHTVGAGGGSIAYIDSGGLLKVGPRSAGADPGPVCYGRGNEEPTVTDANVVLQTLNPEHLLGGRMKIRRDLAERAIGRLAERLGLGIPETAQGILSVVTANMARAIRVISVQRGHDPRDYTLVAFGGAGPLHAARLAKELEIGRVLVPPNPGILCAMGLLLTDLRADFALTRLLPRDRSLDGRRGRSLRRAVAARRALVRARGDRARGSGGIARTVDMRYAGQNYELTVALPDGAITPATLQALAEGFADVAPAAVRLRRRRRAGAAGHVARRGDGHGAQGRASGASRRRAGRIGRHRASPAGVAAGDARFRGHARSTTATPCARATASPAPPSSSRWTRPRWCCPA